MLKWQNLNIVVERESFSPKMGIFWSPGPIIMDGILTEVYDVQVDLIRHNGHILVKIF